MRTSLGGHLLFQQGNGTFQLCHFGFGLGKSLFLLLLCSGLCFLLLIGEFTEGRFRSTLSIPNTLSTRRKQSALISLFCLVLTNPVVDATKILAHLSATEFIDTLNKAVEEVAVVAHNYHRTIEITDGLLEHILGFEVEMVGRLVENKQIDGFEQ